MIEIPGYSIRDRIHEGHKSFVYSGERDIDRLPVILKVMRSDYPSKEDIRRLHHEYQLVRSLNTAECKNIVTVYDLEPVQHRLALVMEDFGGKALDRFFKDRSSGMDSFIPLALSIADGLRELHRQNVVHKNINPSNIIWNDETGELRLIGFSLASRLISENPYVVHPADPAGNPQYISPEQTGRMNRSIDYRTDIYSLGITFYELLTGRPPFVSDEVIEIIHAHMALIPPSPERVISSIPPIIAAIVMKMIAKNAEDRYQTAEGLIADLRECEQRMSEEGRIETFPIGLRDNSGRFRIPEKLYGRNAELAKLLDIFDRVASGEAAITMCSGEPGSGKSALIQEMYKLVVEKRGYFIQGKYEEFQRNVPYSAISQAFGGLVRQILAESEENLQSWRNMLHKSLGINAQVIANVIPELNVLLGPQPPSQAVGIVETQNRFSYVFQNFLNTLTAQRRPLVIFIDDLQWADPASLRLLKILTTNFGNHHILFVGAYRDDEVLPSHPLHSVLREIEQAQIAVTELNIGPLESGDLESLVAETMHCDTEQARSLTEIVLEKTRGNALFVRQFLKSLYDEKLIAFNEDRWTWDVEKIRAQDVTENVVTLMTKRIRKLDPETQTILRMAACLGKSFNLLTLATVSGQDTGHTISRLWPALKDGLISPLDDRYQFVTETDEASQEIQSEFSFPHSRVQQAAYGLIEPGDRPKVHLSIGRLLLASTPDGLLDRKLFDIVSHLNMASELITETRERLLLADVNLRAGRNAKASTAYTAALIYFSIGKDLLPQDSWETEYPMTLALSIEQAQCEYLIGDVEKAKAGFDLILSKAHTALEKAEVLNLMVVISNSLGRYHESIDYGRQGLSLLGMHLPSTVQMTRFRLMIEYAGLQIQLIGRRIEDLLNQATLTAPKSLLNIELCVNVGTAAILHGSGRLYAILSMHMMRRSLVSGNSNRSSTIYLGYALMVAFAASDYRRAFEFGLLGLRLADKYKDSAADAKNFFVWTWISHWKRHLRDSLVYLRTAYEKGLECGDHFFAMYAACNYVIAEIYLGKALESIIVTIAEFQPLVRKLKNPYGIFLLSLCTQYIANLQGRTQDPYSLDGEGFDEAAWLESVRENGSNLVLARYFLCKQEIYYLQGDSNRVLQATADLKPLMRIQMKSYFGYPVMFMYHTLALLELYPDMNDGEKKKTVKTVLSNQTKMKRWAKLCPENYEFMYALCNAELAKVRKREHDATRLYERAVKAAHDSQYTHYEAMANELAARFYDERGQGKIAATYATEAHYLYGKWGAYRKTADLERRYPHLTDHPDNNPKDFAGSGASSDSRGLDLATVFKASQMIAREIRLKPLLTNLMKVVVENSGAVRALLILQRQGDWFVEAELDAGRNTAKVRQSKPLDSTRNLAQSLIKYVLRTEESMVLDNAESHEMFSRDPYVMTHKSKSLLCMPIMNQGRPVGVLYLENSLATGVFTTERLELLRLLSGQIAVSIENAKLFESLQLSMDTQTKLIDKLLHSERLATLGTISAEIAHEINNPNHLVLVNMTTLQTHIKQLLSVLKDSPAGTRPGQDDFGSETGIREAIESVPVVMEDIVNASRRIALIVSGLKEQARADPSSWVTVDLREVVRDAIRFNRHIIEAATDILLVHLPDVPVITHVSPLRLSQVLGNLIQNATHALTDRRQSISIVLTVAEQQKNPVAEITVTDEGSGIDSKDVSRIGEAFFSTRKQQGGTGLGLMIAKRIIAEHGGSFHIAGKKGAGTTARITLPLVPQYAAKT